MKYYLRHNSHRIIKSFGLIFLVTAALIGIWILLNSAGEVVRTNEETKKEVAREDIDYLEATLVSFGSVSWAGSQDRLATPNSLSAIASRDNSNIANLNCAIQTGKDSQFCGRELVGEFAELFSASSLGGLVGTSGDYDSDTTRALSENGVQYFGTIPSSLSPDDCEVVSLRASFVLRNKERSEASLPIVLCGVNGDESNELAIKEEVRELSKILPVWVYTLDTRLQLADPQLIERYRSYIDAGADIVVGQGRAEMGSTEVYKNRLIMYSLGMVMDQSSSQNLKRSVLLKATVRMNNADAYVWQQVAKTCRGFNDLCAEAATSQMLAKPTFLYQFDIAPLNTSDSLAPRNATSIEAAEVYSRLNWYDTSRLLGIE